MAQDAPAPLAATMACISASLEGGAVGEVAALTTGRVLDIQLPLAIRLFAEATPNDPPELPFVRRGADPEWDLAWMLVGADRATLAYDDDQNFDYSLPMWMRKDLAKVAKALQQVRAASAQEVVYTVLGQLCLLQSPTERSGKIPYGVILGYLAQAGRRMTWHRHVDQDGRSNDYVLPAADGASNPINDMMGVGRGPSLLPAQRLLGGRATRPLH